MAQRVFRATAVLAVVAALVPVGVCAGATLSGSGVAARAGGSFGLAGVRRQPVMGGGLVWRACGDGLECGKLSVPVDWARPRGPRTAIDLARMPARHPARSLGPLVVNTGSGPTIQGVRARPDAVSELARWFDVVFVEPRGIGDRGSAATVRCSVPQPDPRRLQLTPGPAAWRAYARDNAAYDRSCRIAAGPAYAGLTSWQVAHDLDAVRAALGQPRLRYFGNSDGAGYGQAYLRLFPRRVERMYLEGVPDHRRSGLGRRLIAHARAAERQLAYFRAWCAGRMGCPLGDRDAVRVLDGLLERAPLPAGPGRAVDGRQIATAVLAGLVPQRWPELAQALSAAEAGDASALAAMVVEERPVAPAMVTRSLHCHDFMPAVPRYRRFLAMEARLREVAPRVGWLTGRYEVGRCLGIPGPPAWPARSSSGASAARPGPGAAAGPGESSSVGPGSSEGFAARPGQGAAAGPGESSAVGPGPGDGLAARLGEGEGSASGLGPGSAAGLGQSEGFAARLGQGESPAAGSGRRAEGSVPRPGQGEGSAARPGEGGGVGSGEGSGAAARTRSGAGRGPVVLVGIGRLDTDAPAAGAARAARSIPGAVVLRHGDGHGAYLLQGAAKLRATCLRARVHDYLVNGTPPPARLRCPGELTAGPGS